jgi:hypothetical protein
VNFFPLLRKPPLIDDEIAITNPSPNHMKHAITLIGFNHEHFNTGKPKIPLYTSPQLLQVLTQELRRPAVRGGEIHTPQLGTPRLRLIAPTGQPLVHAPLLTRPRFENGSISHSYTQPLGAIAPFQCLELSDT